MNNNLNLKIKNLPTISDVIKKYNLSAKKQYSQNYLMDLNLIEKILKLSGRIDSKDIIEIGPGPGNLTRAILANNAKRIIAIEKDIRFIAALNDIKKIANNKLIILNEDALKIKYSDIFKKYHISSAHIISNLPYSISTKLLLKWIPIPVQVNQLTLMFQKEMAERIVAKVGSKKYGRLSVIAGIMTSSKIIMHIPSKVFKPEPKIDSSVIIFKPKNNNKILFKIEILEEITKILFNKRRKQVKTSLKYFGDPEELCSLMNVKPSSRPEQIPLESYEKLAIAITKRRRL